MSGLLKQIQKKSPSSRASSAVILTTSTPRPDTGNIDLIPPMEEAYSTRSIDVRMMEAQQLFDDLAKESAASGASHNAATQIPQSASPDGLVVAAEPEKALRRNKMLLRKSKKSKGDEDSLPAWIKVEKERKLSIPVEALLPLACEQLIGLIKQAGDAVLDIAASTKRAVEQGAQTLPPDKHCSWKDNEIAEKELQQLVSGKGPLQPLYDDPQVSDIYIDSHKSIKVLRRGQMIETPFAFRHTAEYELFVEAMLHSAGCRLSTASPIVNCVLDDKWHSLVNALAATVANSEEPRVCIRVPRQMKVSFYDILQQKILPATLAAWLAELVVQREANILIVGPPGAGKTLLMSALMSETNSDERIVAIEEMPELAASGGNVERLLTRPANTRGEGELSLSDLLETAERRNPHRIVLSNLRGAEARTFLGLLEAGFSGSIASVVGEYSEDGLWRLLDMLLACEKAPQDSLMRRIGRSMHVVISLHLVDGKPCVTEVSEVRPSQAGEFTLVPLVCFDRVIDGKRIWRLMTQDAYWIRRIARRGVGLKTGPALLPLEDHPSEK